MIKKCYPSTSNRGGIVGKSSGRDASWQSVQLWNSSRSEC